MPSRFSFPVKALDRAHCSSTDNDGAREYRRPIKRTRKDGTPPECVGPCLRVWILLYCVWRSLAFEINNKRTPARKGTLPMHKLGRGKTVLIYAGAERGTRENTHGPCIFSINACVYFLYIYIIWFIICAHVCTYTEDNANSSPKNNTPVRIMWFFFFIPRFVLFASFPPVRRRLAAVLPLNTTTHTYTVYIRIYLYNTRVPLTII